MFSKIGRAAVKLALLIACLMVFVPQQSEAASREAVHNLNYFQSYETQVDGRQALRIEIGMDRDNVTYDVTTRPYLQKQLVIDFSNTHPDKVKSSYTLKSKLAKRVHINELEPRHTQMLIDCANPVLDGSYAVHAEPADRKAKKPYRLVIDIFASGGISNAADRVEGVKGHSIVIDPGHGGSDTGAVGPTGVTEASVTLGVSKDLQSILENSGARVTMTRTTDRDVYGPYATDRQELQARVNVGEYTPGAEIFVSIHCNAFSNPASNGMETYYYAGSANGERLATLVNEELDKAEGLFNRGVKTANFYVIKHSSMPATLAELAFITNPQEEHLLANSQYQMKLAKAIARAIGRYFSGD
ncbi:MAG: N-acetylmuramoyl-L-alanine amidase LytC [Mitsuokella multacida]